MFGAVRTKTRKVNVGRVVRAAADVTPATRHSAVRTTTATSLWDDSAISREHTARPGRSNVCSTCRSGNSGDRRRPGTSSAARGKPSLELLEGDHQRKPFLDVCEGCRNYVEQMRVTVGAVGRLRPADLSPPRRSRPTPSIWHSRSVVRAFTVRNRRSHSFGDGLRCRSRRVGDRKPAPTLWKQYPYALVTAVASLSSRSARSVVTSFTTTRWASTSFRSCCALATLSSATSATIAPWPSDRSSPRPFN